MDAAASPIRHTLIAKAFVGSDILSFIIQGAGSGILVSASSAGQATTGTSLLIAGLVIQVLSVLIYLAIAFIFYLNASTKMNKETKSLFIALYVAGVMVLLRSVFRVVEFSSGYAGPIVVNENFMYGLDFVPLCLALICFLIVHPEKVLKEVVVVVHPETEKIARRAIQ